MFSPKTILVTGCAGFIGSNFVTQFKSKYPKTKIIGVDDLSTGREDMIDPSLTFIRGSILDKKLLTEAFSSYKPEYVFHFAARPRVSYSVNKPVLSTKVNIVGTVTLLDVAQKHNVKRFIYSSSSSVYGGAKKLPTKESENQPDPKSPYAIQKYTGELFCKVFSELYGLDTVCLRYFTVFGPGQYGDAPYSTIISAWLESMYFPEAKLGFIEGDGTQSRDFCYIDNVAQANILAMEARVDFGGQAINVAHGEKTTLSQIRKLIEEYSGRRLVLEQRSPRIGDVKHTYASTAKARKLLGYDPKVNVVDGLRETIKWFESRTS